MIRAISGGATLIAFLVLPALLARSVHAANHSGPRVSFTIPTSNVASTGLVMDDRHVVYGVATPHIHRPVQRQGQKPFTNFRVQVYMRDYQRRPTSITVSQPHLLFDGPHGAQIRLDSLTGGWLVYDTHPLQEHWHLFARNVVTDRVILLDSSQKEGQHSLFSHASSDGMTVVWQCSRQIEGPTSVGVWSYILATGRRQLLPSSGTDAKYHYAIPEIWGKHLIMIKESRSRPTSQLFVENLTTRHVRALTHPTTARQQTKQPVPIPASRRPGHPTETSTPRCRIPCCAAPNLPSHHDSPAPRA